MKLKITRDIAWAASTDAANMNMRENGRTSWDEDDYNIAREVFDKLWPIKNDFPWMEEPCTRTQ